MSTKTFKPGQSVPYSGQAVNQRTHNEVTVVRQEPFPPTPKSGDTYKMVDRTKHKK
jgi:hypothetical protein